MKYDVCSSYLKADIYPKLPEKPVFVNTLMPVSSTLKTRNPLKDAKLVFLAGRGIGSRTNYERLKKLAEKYNAVCGCTRPVAMNGWESYDFFVGISGHILEGCTVVAFGVSGAGPLIKGIEKAEKIIAVNSDENALIFDYADYGIIADCMKIIKELEEK